MVNLLPQKTQHSLIKRYYLHLIATFSLFLSILFVVGSILLIPSYFSSKTSADSYERYRDALEGAVGLKERDYVSESVSALSERVRILNEYSNSAFTAGLIDALGEEVGSRISVRNIVFSRSEEGAVLKISGLAGNRQSLLDFVADLKESSAFSQVSLPVSQLVVEEDATFSIQMVYTKQQ